MHVPVDEKVAKIRECLPGANCGACGYTGCDGYAEAIASGEAEPYKCTPGGITTSKALSDLLGVEIKTEQFVAVVGCNHGGGKANADYLYEGRQSCSSAKLLYGGQLECKYGCLGFGDCANVCDYEAIKVVDGVAKVNREKCVGCFACADACPTGALESVGKETTLEAVMQTVLRDAPFYRDGGGLTVSGGEPFMQSNFLCELLKAAKEAGIHTCVETSGCADLCDMLTAKEFVDIFLFDCKLQPGEKHKEFVGSDGKAMHENLKALDKSGAKIILRCPIIPGINDNAEHFKYVSELASSLENLIEINIQPYHNTGVSKAHDIGISNVFEPCDFDAKVFKERIKNELVQNINSSKKIRAGHIFLKRPTKKQLI